MAVRNGRMPTASTRCCAGRRSLAGTRSPPGPRLVQMTPNRQLRRSPVLVCIGGLSATGKTTIARELCVELRASYVRIDTIETAIDNAEGRFRQTNKWDAPPLPGRLRRGRQPASQRPRRHRGVSQSTSDDPRRVAGRRTPSQRRSRRGRRRLFRSIRAPPARRATRARHRGTHQPDMGADHEARVRGMGARPCGCRHRPPQREGVGVAHLSGGGGPGRLKRVESRSTCGAANLGP